MNRKNSGQWAKRLNVRPPRDLKSTVKESTSKLKFVLKTILVNKVFYTADLRMSCPIMHTAWVFVLGSVAILFTMLNGPWTEPVSS